MISANEPALIFRFLLTGFAGFPSHLGVGRNSWGILALLQGVAFRASGFYVRGFVYGTQATILMESRCPQLL